jgi:hypothetical protein
MRRFLILLLLAGCGADEAKELGNAAGNAEVKAAVPAASPQPSEAELAISRAAAEALHRYYAHIGRGDYRSAFAMREPAAGLTPRTFAASFDRYADYRATVGVPSLPVEQDGTVWVSVPVQLYGRMRDGAPMGSVGRVMMKRPPGRAEWQVAP